MVAGVDRRGQLLDAAMELFDERGVRGASMRELSRRAGVDVRTAYYHFESKRDLLRAAFERAGYLEPIDPAVLAALRRMTPRDALASIVRGTLDALYLRAAHNRLIHTQVLVGDADAKAIGTELWQKWLEQLEALLDAGRVVPSPDLERFARYLRSLLWGIFNESQLTGELDEPVRREARASETVELLWSGQHD
jgi:AcrR family transcriptional regulator